MVSRTAIEFRGIARVLEPLFRKQIERQSQEDLNRLKRLLEGDQDRSGVAKDD
jgi:hypothetical protein